VLHHRPNGLPSSLTSGARHRPATRAHHPGRSSCANRRHPRAASPRSSTPGQARQNSGRSPPTSKPSAGGRRSSPTSVTSGSCSPNPTPRQPDHPPRHTPGQRPAPDRGVPATVLSGAAGAMADRSCCEQHRSNTGPGAGKDQHADNTNKSAFPGTRRHNRRSRCAERGTAISRRPRLGGPGCSAGAGVSSSGTVLVQGCTERVKVAGSPVHGRRLPDHRCAFAVLFHSVEPQAVSGNAREHDGISRGGAGAPELVSV
jgi:hypothetical protein